jgi:competence protein ComGC
MLKPNNMQMPTLTNKMLNITNVSKTSGFTLIEVLIATVILFASIVTVSMIYRTATMSSNKAAIYMQVSGQIPAILSEIRFDLREKAKQNTEQLSGQGSGWDITYQWQAIQQEFKAAPEYYDMNTEEVVQPPLKYKLWLVTLHISENGQDNVIKTYSFNELSWLDV